MPAIKIVFNSSGCIAKAFILFDPLSLTLSRRRGDYYNTLRRDKVNRRQAREGALGYKVNRRQARQGELHSKRRSSGGEGALEEKAPWRRGS